MKVAAAFFLVFIALVFFVILQLSDSFVHIYFCDVGQGDSILITYKDTQVLVDGGKDAQVLDCLKKTVPFWDRKIELVVATHADADHIGGLASVVSSYVVEKLLVPAHSTQTADFREFYLAVSREQRSGITLTEPQVGFRVNISNEFQMTVLAHRGADGQLDPLWSAMSETELWDSGIINNTITDETNSGSIVLFMSHKQVSMLLTGDLEANGEQALLSNDLTDRVTILKVGHHGSKTSSSEPFLDQVLPEIAVISVGEKNKYGHPHQEVLTRLQQKGAQIMRTDIEGTIHFVSNGQQVKRAPLWFLL